MPLAYILPVGGGRPDNELPGGPGGTPTPPIVIPPVGVMPPIYIPPAHAAPPIYYPGAPSQGPGFPTNPIAPGGPPPEVWPSPPGGIARPPIYQPPVVWPGPQPPPPAGIWPPPEATTKPVPIPPDTVYPPLAPPVMGKTLVVAWIQGSGWHWLYLDLSQPKK